MDAAQRAPTRRRRGAGQRQRARQGFRRRPAGRSMRRSCATTFHESWHGMAWPWPAGRLRRLRIGGAKRPAGQSLPCFFQLHETSQLYGLDMQQHCSCSDQRGTMAGHSVLCNCIDLVFFYLHLCVVPLFICIMSMATSFERDHTRLSTGCYWAACLLLAAAAVGLLLAAGCCSQPRAAHSTPAENMVFLYPAASSRARSWRPWTEI